MLFYFSIASTDFFFLAYLMVESFEFEDLQLSKEEPLLW